MDRQHDEHDDYYEPNTLDELRRLMAEQDPVLEPDEVLALRKALAHAEMEDGSPDRAVSEFSQLVHHYHEEEGWLGDQTLDLRGSLGRALVMAGRPDEAEAILVEVMADREVLLGPTDPATFVARGNLMRAIAAAGRTTEALDLANELLAERLEVLGSDHPDTFNSRGFIAQLLAATGRGEEAIEAYELLLIDRERVLGIDDPATRATRYNLLQHRVSMGSASLAEVELRLVEAKIAIDRPLVRLLERMLVRMYAADGQVDIAGRIAAGLLFDCEELQRRGDDDLYADELSSLFGLVAETLGAEHPLWWSMANRLECSYEYEEIDDFDVDDEDHEDVEYDLSWVDDDDEG